MKLRSGPSTESFLAFGDLEYSKFLDSFLTFSYNRTTGKRNMVLWLKTNNDTQYIHLTVRVCTTKRFFSEHVFIKISYCVFKIMILKMKKKQLKVS